MKNYPLVWPQENLESLSEKSREFVCHIGSSIVGTKSFIEVENFSSYNKLLRVTACVIKFVWKLRGHEFDQVFLREKAKFFLIKLEQEKFFDEEIRFLKTEKKCDKIPNLVNNLNLFIDEQNILRSKGRIDKCTAIDKNLINPILLPKSSNLTKLMIFDFHERCKHLGINTTLTLLRNSGFWVVKGRAVIKSVLDHCYLCKKLNSFSFKYPRNTGYVADRVNFVTPFKHVGVDYTSHFFLKHGDSVSKFYVLVFTCLNIRAVYLDVVPSMSTSDFLLALIKFISYYNVPTSIYSDNGSSFCQAAKILKDAHLDENLNEFLVRNSIRFVKIPVYSAWVGTYWERLIRCIKSCIFKVMGRRTFELYQFSSLLAEVQNVVNERPLTYRDSDANNLDVITPNSFLKLRVSQTLNFGSVDGSQLEMPGRNALIKTLDKREELMDKFKTIWYEQYLLSLREESKDLYQSSWEDRVKPGDVVLLFSPIKSRHCWTLGKVVDLLTGSDGKTRCARVKRPNQTVEVYSISHLYPIELTALPEICDNPEVENTTEIAPLRPVRAAALKCKKLLKKN